jgi:hypothetical protein
LERGEEEKWERTEIRGGGSAVLGFWGVNKATLSGSTISASTWPPVILAVMHTLNLLITC